MLFTIYVYMCILTTFSQLQRSALLIVKSLTSYLSPYSISRTNKRSGNNMSQVAHHALVVVRVSQVIVDQNVLWIPSHFYTDQKLNQLFKEFVHLSRYALPAVCLCFNRMTTPVWRINHIRPITSSEGLD